ncbi:hypothetical protein BGW41_005583 [Actinomortierella wolfii]|nr:hypothetical protein BGW41_005583 [Actinomortierella wolfii]
MTCIRFLKTFSIGFYDFALEHRIVQEYQRILIDDAAQTTAKDQKYRAYVEEREARLKQERISRARKIAPGYLDNDDRKLLTPTLASATPASSSGTPGNQSPATKHQPAIDYSEFELQDISTKSISDTDDSSQIRPKANDSTTSPATAATTGVSDANADENAGETTTTSASDALSDDVVRPHEATDDQIVRAVPLSELTGLLRDSALGTASDTSSSSRPQPWNTVPEKTTSTARVDFREFEQGLGPPDPWEAPVDDLAVLKDVISQQLGQPSNTTMLGSHPGQPHDPTATQPHRPFHTPDPYAHPTPSKQGPAHVQAHPMPAPPSYTASSDIRPAPTSHFHSSPLPIGASPGVIKQHQQFMEYNQAYMMAQQHQHQHQHQHQAPLPPPHPHRHSTTGLSVNQQHARFGSASPSPPPLPPPPRDLTSSPHSTNSSVSQPRLPLTSGSNQPPVPARPSQFQLGSSPMESVVITDRSMNASIGGNGSGGPPPRPPLPPPPRQSSASPALPPHPSRIGDGLDGPGVLGGDGTGGVGHEDLASNMSSPEQQLPLPPNASMLIDQLVNMGFTREQSREALEKYDYDLEKASNHLLDWG